MHHLLVDRQTCAPGERHLDARDAVILEERFGAVTAVKIFDRPINLDGLDAGPGHFAHEAVSGRDHPARLAHEPEFAGRFQFGPILEEFAEHANQAYSGIKATIR